MLQFHYFLGTNLGITLSFTFLIEEVTLHSYIQYLPCNNRLHVLACQIIRLYIKTKNEGNFKYYIYTRESK